LCGTCSDSDESPDDEEDDGVPWSFVTERDAHGVRRSGSVTTDVETGETIITSTLALPSDWEGEAELTVSCKSRDDDDDWDPGDTYPPPPKVPPNGYMGYGAFTNGVVRIWSKVDDLTTKTATECEATDIGTDAEPNTCTCDECGCEEDAPPPRAKPTKARELNWYNPIIPRIFSKYTTTLPSV